MYIPHLYTFWDTTGPIYIYDMPCAVMEFEGGTGYRGGHGYGCMGMGIWVWVWVMSMSMSMSALSNVGDCEVQVILYSFVLYCRSGWLGCREVCI